MLINFIYFSAFFPMQNEPTTPDYTEETGSVSEATLGNEDIHVDDNSNVDVPSQNAIETDVPAQLVIVQ